MATKCLLSFFCHQELKGLLTFLVNPLDYFKIISWKISTCNVTQEHVFVHACCGKSGGITTYCLKLVHLDTIAKFAMLIFRTVNSRPYIHSHSLYSPIVYPFMTTRMYLSLCSYMIVFVIKTCLFCQYRSVFNY